MRIATFLSLVLFLSPLQVSAQWYAGGEPVPDEPWRKSNEGFGAMLLFTRHNEALTEAWEREPSPDYKPEIITCDEVARNEPIMGVVFFTGCAPDEQGNCDADVRFTIIEPDGETYGELPPAELWQGKPAPPAHYVQLGVARMGVRIEDGEKLGPYEVRAEVCDRNAGNCLILTGSFRATDPYDLLDMEKLIDTYYSDPRPALVGPAAWEACESGLLLNDNTTAPMVGFLAGAFMSENGPLYNWPEAELESRPDCRERVAYARSLASDFEAVFAETDPTPGQNDLLWGLYFATGNRQFLERLADNLRFVAEREDLMRFMTGATAKWSLASNAGQHERVRLHLEELQAEAEGERAEALSEVLTIDPESVMPWFEEVLRDNRAKGVW